MFKYNHRNIIIIEKPEEIGWDAIHSIIFASHTSAHKDGGVQATAFYSGEELRHKIGGGKCFVALDEGVAIGTCSLVIKEIHAWFYSGEVAYYMWDAVLPSYQGTGVYSQLDEARDQYIRERNVKVIITRTSERNRKMQRIRMRKGYRKVSFAATTQTNYYSVLLARWVDECPFPLWYCFLRYKLIEIKTRLLYKEGGSETCLMRLFSTLRSLF